MCRLHWVVNVQAALGCAIEYCWIVNVQAALDCAIDYASRRTAFGAPISKLQAIQVAS